MSELFFYLNGQQLMRGKKHSYVYVVQTVQPIKRAIIFSFVCETVESIRQVKSGFSVWVAVVEVPCGSMIQHSANMRQRQQILWLPIKVGAEFNHKG